jgi:hypothetical protein
MSADEIAALRAENDRLRDEVERLMELWFYVQCHPEDAQKASAEAQGLWVYDRDAAGHALLRRIARSHPEAINIWEFVDHDGLHINTQVDVQTRLVLTAAEAALLASLSEPQETRAKDCAEGEPGLSCRPMIGTHCDHWYAGGSCCACWPRDTKETTDD